MKNFEWTNLNEKPEKNNLEKGIETNEQLPAEREIVKEKLAFKAESPDKEKEKKDEPIKKRFFVTGVTGFIGSNLAVGLLREGHTLFILARATEKKSAEEKVEESLRPLCKDDQEFDSIREQYKVITGDVEKADLGIDSKTIKDIGQIDEVIHLAANLSFRKSDREKLFRTNVDGTENLLKLSERLAVKKFNLLSTAYVSGKRDGIVQEVIVPEKEKPEFHNPYEESKYFAEQKVTKWNERTKIPCAVFRPSIVISKERVDTVSGYYAFAAALALARQRIFLSNEKVKIPCNPKATLNLISIDDVTNSIQQALAKKTDTQEPLEVFHITNPHTISMKDISEHSLKILGLQNKVELVEGLVEGSNEGELTKEMRLKLSDMFPFLFTDYRFDVQKIRRKLEGRYDPEEIDDEFLQKMLQHKYTPDAEDSWLRDHEKKRKLRFIPAEFRKPIAASRPAQLATKTTLAIFKKAIDIFLKPSGIEKVHDLYEKESSEYKWKHHLTTAFNDEKLRREAANEVVSFLSSLQGEGIPKIIDIATGTGLNLQKLNAALKRTGREYELYGIDFTDAMLHIAAKQKFISEQKNVYLKRADATNLVGIQEGEEQEFYKFKENSIDCITTVFGIGGIQNASKAFEDQLRILKLGGISILIDMHAPALGKEDTKLPLGLGNSTSLVRAGWEEVTKPIALKKLWGWKDPTEDFYIMPIISYHDSSQDKFFGFELMKREIKNMKWWFGLPVMPVGKLVVKKVEITQAEFLIRQSITHKT